MQKKFAALIAMSLLAVPGISLAGIAGTNTVNSAAIVDGSIATVDIAPGAVTDAKISGTISANKLPVGTTSTTVAAGDHNHDAVYAKKYANIIVVAKSGGDFTDPVAAMNSITNASATTPYLVKILPGEYNIGSTSLNMKDYVDVEGAGEAVTKIIGSVPSTPKAGVVNGAFPAGQSINEAGPEIRQLTVENTFAGGFAVHNGVIVDGNATYGAKIKVTNVTAIARNGGVGINLDESGFPVEITNVKVKTVTQSTTMSNYGIKNYDGIARLENVEINTFGGLNAYAIYNDYGSMRINNVRVNVQGASQYNTGLEAHNSGPFVNNLTVEAFGSTPYNAYGVANFGQTTLKNSSIMSNAIGVINFIGTINVENSSIFPDGSGISNAAIENANSATTNVAGSKVFGSIKNFGTMKCISVYDNSYNPVSCQ